MHSITKYYPYQLKIAKVNADSIYTIANTRVTNVVYILTTFYFHFYICVCIHLL